MVGRFTAEQANTQQRVATTVATSSAHQDESSRLRQELRNYEQAAGATLAFVRAEAESASQRQAAEHLLAVAQWQAAAQQAATDQQAAAASLLATHAAQQRESSALCDTMYAEGQTLERKYRSEETAKLAVQMQVQELNVASIANAQLVQGLRQQVDQQNDHLRRIERLLELQQAAQTTAAQTVVQQAAQTPAAQTAAQPAAPPGLAPALTLGHVVPRAEGRSCWDAARSSAGDLRLLWRTSGLCESPRRSVSP